ncbi:MAG: hypothetical protein IJM44_00055 [Ruminococcus sp.]|nr:hypothetical protein [Ruminococcus sp.]
MIESLAEELFRRGTAAAAEMSLKMDQIHENVKNGSLPGTEYVSASDPKTIETISAGILKDTAEYDTYDKYNVAISKLDQLLLMQNADNYGDELMEKASKKVVDNALAPYVTGSSAQSALTSKEQINKNKGIADKIIGNFDEIDKKGFVFRNGGGKPPYFDDVPDDIKKIQKAKNITDLEKLKTSYQREKAECEKLGENADKNKLNDLKTSIRRVEKAEKRMFMKKEIAEQEKKIAAVDSYTDKISELHSAMKNDIKYILDDYKKRKDNNENMSPEYKEYAESVKNLDYAFRNSDGVSAKLFTSALERTQKAALTDYAAEMLAFKLNSDAVESTKNNYDKMSVSEIKKLNETTLSENNLKRSAEMIKETDSFTRMMDGVNSFEDIQKLKGMCERNRGAELIDGLSNSSKQLEGA